MKRIIFSARDMGAAQSILPVLLALQAKTEQIVLCTMEPATSFFKRHQESFLKQVTQIAILPKDPELLTEEAFGLYHTYRPFLVFTGSSGLDFGIDEAFIHAVKGFCPILTYQDFWGDINPHLRQFPDLMLVGDAYAAAVTKKRASQVVTRIVGYPKYYRLEEVHPLDLKGAMRRHLNLPESSRVLGLFTQPLWHLEAYAAMVEQWCQWVAGHRDRVFVVCRFHPRDPESAHLLVEKWLRLYEIPFALMDGWEIEASLVVCDAVFSAYSSCALDAVMLNRQSLLPVVLPVYLLSSAPMRDFYHHYTGLEDLPLVSNGTALRIYDQHDFDDMMSHLSEYKQSVWTASHEHMFLWGHSVQRIVEIIMQEVIPI